MRCPCPTCEPYHSEKRGCGAAHTTCEKFQEWKKWREDQSHLRHMDHVIESYMNKSRAKVSRKFKK